MPTPIVIDLSHHNTVPDSLVPTKNAGIIGVIHKATEGESFKDSKVDAREFLTRDAGLLFGLYHFIRPGSMSKQVDNFMSVYKRYDSTNLLAVLDYEDSAVSLANCEEWIKGVVGRTGKPVVMYSGHVLKEKTAGGPHPYLNEQNCQLWLAQYTSGKPSLPLGWSRYWLWQYTEDGSIAGVTPPTDLNAGDKDFVRQVWQNGSQPEPVPPTSLDFSDAMRRVLDGERMRRKGWNGKGMFIMYHVPVGDITYPFIAMQPVGGGLVPWLASQTDMCASDWEVVS